MNDASSARTGKRSRVILAGVFAMSVATITGAGAYAGLNATATGSTNASSGTLLLTLSPDTGSVGLANTTPAMAPGDVDNVYVDLANTGSLDSAAGMTLTVTGSPANNLTSPGGLTVALTQCSVAWANGACSGTSTQLLAATPVSTLANPQSLAGVPALAAAGGSLAHLQVSLALPASIAETSINGVIPSTGNYEGLSTTLTYTFNEVQRTAVTTNQ